MNQRLLHTILPLVLIPLLAACGGIPEDVRAEFEYSGLPDGSGNFSSRTITSIKAIQVSDRLQAQGIKVAWCLELHFETVDSEGEILGSSDYAMVAYRHNGVRAGGQVNDPDGCKNKTIW